MLSLSAEMQLHDINLAVRNGNTRELPVKRNIYLPQCTNVCVFHVPLPLSVTATHTCKYIHMYEYQLLQLNNL